VVFPGEHELAPGGTGGAALPWERGQHQPPAGHVRSVAGDRGKRVPVRLRPGEEGTYRDAEAAYQWLVQRGFAGTNIVAFGESLGGGVAAELAVHEPLGGLVLQSTFTSIPDIGSELFPWLPVRWLATISYDTRSKLPRLRIPVLVMHSRADEIVPFHHGERNFAAANEPKLFWELPGDHNGALGNARHFIAGVEQFLGLVEAGRSVR
jgi:fermentation-respiration switch protein FrsA (DUF1100 family)